MSDKLYAIKESTLSALGDAIRSKSGETRIEPISYKVSDVCMWNAIGYDYLNDDILIKTPYEWGYSYNYPKHTYTIENAHSIRVMGKVYFHMNVSGTAKLTANILPYEYTSGTMDVSNGYQVELAPNESIKVDTIIENTNIITIAVKPKSTQCAYAYYFEVTGLDENNNPLESCNYVINGEMLVKNTMTPLKMVDAIGNIGNEPIILTGSISNAFRHTPQSVIDEIWPRIRTNDLTNAVSFVASESNNKIDTIPFDINMKVYQYTTNDYRLSLGSIFSSALYLQTLPKINVKWDIGHINYLYQVDLSSLFNGCRVLKEIPYNYLNDIFNNEAYKEQIKNTSQTYSASLFYGCYALRKHPNLSILNTFKRGYYDGIYYQGFYNCHSLDEIIDVPVIKDTTMNDYNGFTSTFYGTCRAKNITFKKVDEPIVWSNQNLSFENSGYCFSSTETTMLKYNPDMNNKKVFDDATYQALKNDPDWYSNDINYSRYNRISAINTINSLPDTSEQVALTGKPNRIRFKGQAGALTDGGAINTMTEEEIAVATAKGWTVAFS